MLSDRIEAKWIDAFAKVFELCKVAEGEEIALLSETQSRALNIHLAELALLRMGAKPFHVILPTPPQRVAVPVRSTGASDAMRGLKPAINALKSSSMVVDLTVEGMLHAPELPEIISEGARLLMISNEHPEALERLLPDPALTPKVKAAVKMLRASSEMTVVSAAGTDLKVDMTGAPTAGVWGYCDRPGTVAHWPGGVVVSFPGANTVNGKLVLDVGDINITFKRYLQDQVILTIENDYVVDIAGKGTDVELIRRYFAAWDDPAAYATSHVGWGMNPGARYEALTMYDQRETNGTELRAYPGNFLYSTGANEVAGRHTLGHFDLPCRNHTVELDGTPVVIEGKLQGDLA